MLFILPNFASWNNCSEKKTIVGKWFFRVSYCNCIRNPKVISGPILSKKSQWSPYKITHMCRQLHICADKPDYYSYSISKSLKVEAYVVFIFYNI
jgi:hypothetical protein